MPCETRELNPEDVQYVNAHGTSTPLGDKAETIAVKRAFGEHASKLVVNSTKSMTGHLLGAAGGYRGAVYGAGDLPSGLAADDQYLQSGEGCDLDYCANEARQLKIDVAISNSFGFGGTNATVVFKRI
jgi:3-oxoacyl-[acyl-carrier-protein] synthase II